MNETDSYFTTVGWPFGIPGDGCYLFLYPVAARIGGKNRLPSVLLGLATIRRDGLIMPPGSNGDLWKDLQGLERTTALRLRFFGGNGTERRGVLQREREICECAAKR